MGKEYLINVTDEIIMEIRRMKKEITLLKEKISRLEEEREEVTELF